MVYSLWSMPYQDTKANLALGIEDAGFLCFVCLLLCIKGDTNKEAAGDAIVYLLTGIFLATSLLEIVYLIVKLCKRRKGRYKITDSQAGVQRQSTTITQTQTHADESVANTAEFNGEELKAEPAEQVEDTFAAQAGRRGSFYFRSMKKII